MNVLIVPGIHTLVSLAVQDVCMERGIPAPCIVSESGRALASHHAVMVFDVLSRWANRDKSGV